MPSNWHQNVTLLFAIGKDYSKITEQSSQKKQTLVIALCHMLAL